MIAAQHLGRHGIVHDASFSVAPGEFVVLLGPNGAGKTTLLRLTLGLARADEGRATIDGEDAAHLSPPARARRIAYLPQSRSLAWPIRVRDAVALGRYAHGAAPSRLGPTDADAVKRAIAACDLDHLAERAADTLSGGELARVHLARALAAETPLIVADEPTAALDPRHQHRVMGMLRAFVAAGGGVLAVLHDLALAAAYADRLIWMVDGGIVIDGTVAETMTKSRIADIYGVDATIADRTVAIQGLLPD